MATQYKVKVKEGLENITSSLTGSWKGIYTCKTASGYEPFSNLYAMFNMTIYEQSGGLYANLDSPLLEKCSDVEIITIGDATLTITGIEPHYGGKLTLSFIGFSIDSFSGSVVFSLSNVEVGTGSCSLSRNETNIIPDTPSIDFTSNQEFDQNTSKKPHLTLKSIKKKRPKNLYFLIY